MHSRREYMAGFLHLCSAVNVRGPFPMSSESAITAAETPAANGHGEAHSTAGFKALMLDDIQRRVFRHGQYNRCVHNIDYECSLVESMVDLTPEQLGFLAHL